ncbi:MAG: hypothetical protein IPL49_04905 [Saprospirales bacterium]|nr:hypothetical protein [Saprospirales bacterium]MBK8490250.1 hypothetical protein [Saprospirales bacterium]
MARPQGALFGINLLGKKEKWQEAYRYLHWRRKYAPALRKFHNIHRGQDCFIMGNGPSLGQMDLSPLANYHTFGLNKIYLIFDRFELDLSYLVSTNALVIEQSHAEFEQMDCPVFLSYTASQGVVADRPHIHRMHTLNTWSFYEDLSQPICEGNTVTFVALQIAYYMGFERVFLIGVDHSFKQSGSAHETQVFEGEDVNHFHPDYFKGQQWQLADVYGSEVSYHLANYFYRKDERQILDATVGGKLTVFPKVSFEDALAQARPKK